MSWQIKIYLSLTGLFLVLSLSLYLLFTRNPIQKQPTEKDLLEKSFTYIEQHKDFIIDELVKNIEKNSNKITHRNCLGFLEVSNSDFYKETELFKDIKPDIEKKINVLYDFCSYNTKKGSPATFYLYTKDMFNKYRIEKNSIDYIPVIKTVKYKGDFVWTKAVMPVDNMSDFF